MRARRLSLFLVVALACSTVVSAKAQQASSSSTTSAADNNGLDFTRPENLFQIRNLYQTAPGNGSVPGTLRTVTTISVPHGSGQRPHSAAPDQHRLPLPEEP
jgi:hypothetical protein